MQQLAALMAKILQARSSTVEMARFDVAAAESQLDDLYLANLGTSRSLVRRLGLEDLIGVIGTAGHVDGERAYVFGALLSTEAEVAIAGGADAEDPEVLALRNSALAMFLEAGAERLGEADLDERVQALLAAVHEDAWPLSTYERRFRYEFAGRRYSRAEDALFDWLDNSTGFEQRLEVAATADAFYTALEELKDKELTEGGFERDEIAEGRADFAERVGG